MNEPEIAAQDNWTDDVLNRKPYADFLTKFLIAKTNGPDNDFSRSFTLAIDAKWGNGKTFFVTKWLLDLEVTYPTVYFDAWKADYAGDPLVAFMSAFKTTLDQEINLSGDTAFVEMKSAIAHKMRKAALPAGKVLLKGLLSKVVGVSTDELWEVIQGTDEPSVDFEKLEKGGLESVNKSLDEYFNKVLEEQSGRQKAIDEFKESIKISLKKLADEEKITLPMFVFIDELDRCRPSFAISLLEGVKHLFDIEGVCFVVSTNMEQLSESVKSVYGSGFDGYGYLKRLFDAEYTLPTIGQPEFSKLIVTEHPEFNQRAVLGTPACGFGNPPTSTDASVVLAWVAEVFELDLRSQRRIADIALAARSGMPHGNKVYLLWLLTLCAIRHKDPSIFEALGARPFTETEFGVCWKTLAKNDRQRSYLALDNFGNYRDYRDIALLQVAWLYYEQSFLDMKEVRRDLEEYPRSVLNEVLQFDTPRNGYDQRKRLPTTTSTYFELIRTAGHFVSE